jgi:hypothetical protein
MKLLSFALFVALVGPSLVRSQDAPVVETRESAIVPAAIPTTARILGDIPDGTPPAPQPPKPPFVVPPRDILATTTQQQGGRTITFQKIKPIALPPAPEPAPLVTALDDAAFAERVAASKAKYARSYPLALGATIYRFKDSPSRTLVQYRPDPDGEPISFWSSADFSLIAGGIHSFVDSAGKTHTLLLAWSIEDISRTAAIRAAREREYHAPVIPVFPAGPATFSFIGAQPDAETLVVIQSLHDVYNSEYARLKTAYEGRERARIEREAWLKANPPQPKNITLNYGRTEKPVAAQGGGQ